MKAGLPETCSCLHARAMDTSESAARVPQCSAPAFNSYPEVTALPPRLCFLVDEGQQELIPKGYHVTVGRTRQSALQVKHSSVSERHAVISWTGQHWQLEDVGSSFGTVHNGKLLNSQGELPLQPRACSLTHLANVRTDIS